MGKDIDMGPPAFPGAHRGRGIPDRNTCPVRKKIGRTEHIHGLLVYHPTPAVVEGLGVKENIDVGNGPAPDGNGECAAQKEGFD